MSTSDFERDLINAEKADASMSGPDATIESPIAPPSSGALAIESFTGYEVLREIHRGGQGIVYQAIQKNTKRKVAIKVMKEGPFAGPADKARFEREVQVLGQLNHPNIVGVHDSGQAAGHFYFVMDYVSGQPLDVFMAGGEHSIEDTLKLFSKICEAVNAAHLKGVIHRDLKPGNIRVDSERQPHILDFGLARTATTDAGAAAMTMTGQFLGSLPWASPEQAEAIPHKIDMRTDVYSLGVILYHVLTGKFPYEVIGNMRDVLDRIMKTEPARPSSIVQHGRPARGRINDEIDTIVLKCLSKERDRRYQTAGELARDIEHYLRGEPIEAKRDSVGYVLRKQLKRYRLPAAVAAGFVGVVTIGLIASLAFWRQAVKEREMLRRAEQEQRRLAEAESAARKEAQRQQHIAEAVSPFLKDVLRSPEPNHEGQQGIVVADAMMRAVKLLDNGRFKNEPEVEARLRITISWILNGNGRQKEGLAQSEKALAINQRLHAGDHMDVAESLSNVACCQELIGHAAEAEPLWMQALEMRQRLYKGDHPDVVRSLNNLADVRKSLGRATEAEPLYVQALEMNQRLLKGDNLDVAWSLRALAGFLADLNRFDEALRRAEQAAAMATKVLPKDCSQFKEFEDLPARIRAKLQAERTAKSGGG